MPANIGSTNYILNRLEKQTLKSAALGLSSTILDKNIGTNNKFYRKVACLMYTEMFNFRSQS